MNRTVVELIALEPVTGAEVLDIALDLLLLSLEERERDRPFGEGAQELANQRAYRGAALGGANPRIAVDVIGN